MGIFKEGVREKIALSLVLLVIIAAIFVYSGQEKNQTSSVQPTVEAASTSAASADNSEISVLEKNLEDKISVSLEKIQGVGKVKVLVTYTSGLRKEYATDESVTKKTSKQTDQGGGTSTTEEVTQNHQLVLAANSSPVIVVEQRPQLAGVLVIAQGASDPKIKEQIFDAVRILLNIEPSKISVAPMGGV